MTETEIKELKKAVLERWEGNTSNSVMGLIEVLKQVPELRKEFTKD